MKNFKGNSRATFRAKRKKTNLILNGSIAIVLILIVIVSYSVFSSGGNKGASQKSVQASAEKQSANNITDKTAAKKSSTSNQSNDVSTPQDQTQNDQTNSDTASTGNSSSSFSGSSQSDSTTSPTPETPAPETPAQTGQQHVTNYDSSSQDWQEMLQAIASATGIDQSNMNVWWLGSDKSNPGGSVGIVSAKGNSSKYRVYLQWNGAGYNATKVEPAS